MRAWIHMPYFGKELTAIDQAWHKNFHRLIFEGSRYPLRIILPLLSKNKVPPSHGFIRRIRKDLEALLEQDIQNVIAGYYPKSALHFPLLNYIYAVISSGPLDALNVIERAKNNSWNELPPHVNKDSYPEYYLRNFHWQTDGWFSEESAQRYDASVQFLFGGVADIMRRMALPPIARSIAGKRDVKILELACGTGSFIPQLQAAFPNARIYAIDLSPDYINHARKHSKGLNVQYSNENAENLSFQDKAFDAVICHNLFHELPPQARRNVFTETHRVLKNSGIFSITDSVQLGDNPNMNDSIDNFSKRFHEPFHKQYIGDNLEDVYTECSFEVGESQVNLFSKSIYGTKLG